MIGGDHVGEFIAINLPDALQATGRVAYTAVEIGHDNGFRNCLAEETFVVGENGDTSWIGSSGLNSTRNEEEQCQESLHYFEAESRFVIEHPHWG